METLPDADVPDLMIRIDGLNAFYALKLTDDKQKEKDPLLEDALDDYEKEYTDQIKKGKSTAEAKTEAEKKLDCP